MICSYQRRIVVFPPAAATATGKRARRYKVTFHHPCREANWAFGARTDHFGMCLRPGDALIFSVDGHPLGSRWPHWGSRWPERGFEERCYIKTIEQLPPPERAYGSLLGAINSQCRPLLPKRPCPRKQ
jgi:hypothetical protein